MTTPTREVQLLMDETSKQALAEEVLRLRASRCAIDSSFVSDRGSRYIGKIDNEEISQREDVIDPEFGLISSTFTRRT